MYRRFDPYRPSHEKRPNACWVFSHDRNCIRDRTSLVRLAPTRIMLTFLENMSRGRWRVGRDTSLPPQPKKDSEYPGLSLASVIGANQYRLWLFGEIPIARSSRRSSLRSTALAESREATISDDDIQSTAPAIRKDLTPVGSFLILSIYIFLFVGLYMCILK